MCQIKYVTVKIMKEFSSSVIVNRVLTVEYTMQLSLKDSENNAVICSN